MLYGTTRKFLEIFGLNSLKDLPKVEELRNPDRR
jgi:segregation and condensation protein B